MNRRAERWRSECRWAWLNLRARGWRAGLAIALLAVALGANAIVFSAADSIVFHRTPFADGGRLVEIHQRDPLTGRPGDAFISAALFDEWRRQTDLFTSVHGFLYKNLFLSVLGIAGAIAASRWVQSQLFGVRATDPGIIVAVTIGVAAAALLSTWQPARHAARIDPKALLRN
jgi:ABC-type antimicrobial peptide transport system permease subunit